MVAESKARVLIIGTGGVGTMTIYALEIGAKAEATAALRSSHEAIMKNVTSIDSLEHGQGIKGIDEIGRKTPLLVDLKTSGENYMTDFHNSGGMSVLLRELKSLLYLDAMTITGRTLGQELASATILSIPTDLSIVRPFDEPLYPASSLAVLRGNLAPGGCVIKASASKVRRLLKHSGRAVVFANSADLAARIDDPHLDVTADDVLVLKNIGPIGNPGMPEAGVIPIPRKLSSQGVMDMLRISDGRMSGTAGGTIILHVSPEAADPKSVLGIIETGDIVTCDLDSRSINVNLSSEEIDKRQAKRMEELKTADAPWMSREATRGYRGLYMRTVNQAEEGADLDFLRA
ncbi:hypothetical protein PFICI_08187 [Pestalotiopsis fici W106-1]|uniref:Dihydroxy-acid dehydratase n=1 Tax=Pestalotiopsis fici (strain W106-1 / CGMCC3.15140) TaxID=1229662 RepID=W3X3E7_PESFW|nr:uncharacterized protein PFICI_08187 [Pestalotiopsis fici W106-1]ETS80658.1 hypothetical protein PFICI_08187 [Pestalotiopsis fici W106-1]